MKPECITAVEKAAGRSLTKGEVDGIDMRMRTALRDLSTSRSAEFLSMPPAERVQEAAKLAKERMMQDVVAAHENEIRSAQIRASLDSYLERFEPGKNGRLLAAVNRVFYDAGSRAGETSVEINRKAVMADFMRQLSVVQKVDPGKFFGLVQDLTKRDAIIKELSGERSGDPDAVLAAKAFQELNKAAAERARRAGLSFHEMENWRAPQPSDWTLIAGKKQQWLDDHMELVDRRAYVNADGTRMDDTQLKSFLEKVYQTLSTDGANKKAESEGGGYGGLGTNRSLPRQLHYKDAASYTAAMEKYGKATNVYSLFMQHFNALSRDIAIAETLGRDHQENFSRMINRAFEADSQAVKTQAEKYALESMKKNAQAMYSVLANGEGIGNQLWAQRMAATRSVISSSMIGNVFSAIGDFAGLGLTAKLNGLPVLRSMTQALKSAFSKGDAELLERVGLVIDGMQTAANRHGLDEIGAGAPAVLNEAVQKLSFLKALDRGMRSGIGLSIMDMLGKLTRSKSLADIAGGDNEFLVMRNGVTETHWNVWKAAEVDGGPKGKRTILTPDAIYSIPDEKMRPVVQDQIAARSDVYKAEVERLSQRREQEIGWLAGKVEKLSDLRDRAGRIISSYAGTRVKNLSELRSAIDARAEVTRARVEAAEIEHDIAGYLKTEKAQGRIDAFLKAVENGASVERKVVRQRVHPDNMTDAVVDAFQKTPAVGERAASAVENYGRSINAAAEALGARRARAEARIKAAETRFQELTEDAEAEVKTKVSQYEAKIAKSEKEIGDFAASVKDRVARYAEYEKAFQDKFGKIEAEEIARAKSDAAEKLLAVALSEIQVGARGAAGASIKEKTALGLATTQAGTFGGEFMRMFLLMKQTPFGVAHMHLMQRPAALDGNASQWAYRAQFIAYTTLLGAVASQLSSIVSGKDPEDMETPEFWGKALVKGGGFGIYGDVLFADSANTTNTLAGIVGGPGLSAMEDAFRLYQGAKRDMAETGDYKMGSKTVEFMRKYATPLANVWYTKAAFNHMIYYNLQEMLDPGWASRLRNRTERKGTSYWWAPDEATPGRSPDFSRVSQ